MAAARLRLEERENCRQLLPLLSSLSRVVRPAPEPFGRLRPWQAAAAWGLMVAEPTASYEPMTFWPLTVTTFDSAFMTPWVVSEPTPASGRWTGVPDGSAWAVPVPATSRPRPLRTVTHLANVRLLDVCTGSPLETAGNGVLDTRPESPGRVVAHLRRWSGGQEVFGSGPSAAQQPRDVHARADCGQTGDQGGEHHVPQRADLRPRGAGGGGRVGGRGQRDRAVRGRRGGRAGAGGAGAGGAAGAAGAAAGAGRAAVPGVPVPVGAGVAAPAPAAMRSAAARACRRRASGSRA